jgi:urate oxidase
VRDGEDKRHVSVVVDGTKGKNNLSATCKSGVSDLLVLKSTGSSFENFVRDKYTTLPEVDDRIFSTSVECSYEIPIPASALSAAALPKIGIPFDSIFDSVMTTTLEIFSEHDSASVQATLYLMCEKILNDNKHVSDVGYKLPNKHYFAVNMDYIGVKNTKPKDAEVFQPVADPSGLIIATVSRDAKAKL